MISVIIPTLNEVKNLPHLLVRLGNETTKHEVIVVDGGSDDGTPDAARRYGAQVVEMDAGRGNQLRRGAEQASGGILLFLHADSEFPVGGLNSIDQIFATSTEIVGGNFRLLFGGKTKFSRLLTCYYALIRSCGYYYGDSAIFVLRKVYDTIGGVRPIALMEDFDFVRRMERFGKTMCIKDPPLVTSSRRFENRNLIGVVFSWLKIHILYRLGVSPKRLAEIYYCRRY